MHGYETLTAPADTATSPSVESDAVGPAPVQHGDFAAGLRMRPHDAGAYGTFATGMSESSRPAARTLGEFASRTRSHGGPRVIGDFATGMRARADWSTTTGRRGSTAFRSRAQAVLGERVKMAGAEVYGRGRGARS